MTMFYKLEYLPCFDSNSGESILYNYVLHGDVGDACNAVVFPKTSQTLIRRHEQGPLKIKKSCGNEIN